MLETAIYDKSPRFLSIFLVTTLIGILFISLAVYRASRELEIIHEVDNVHRLTHAMLGEDKISRLVEGEQHLIPGLGETDYRFYVFTENQLQPLHKPLQAKRLSLNDFNIEETRVNKRGGYFETDDGQLFTWVDLTSNQQGRKQLLVIHRFKSEGVAALSFVYQKRIIIPAFFYLWLMVWVSLMFSHLLKKVKNQQEEMRHMALHDPLTALPNRMLMEDRLQKLISIRHRDKKKFAFSLIDMDNFKSVNDNYGHAYGDELLRQVARRLEGVLRESDTAARHGGDEFTLILADIDETAWHAAFMRVLTALVEPYTLLDKTVSINASIGVAIYPVHGEDVESLLHNADEAMYSIKAEGGGVRIFENKDKLEKQVH